jgi:hypothetical protein
MLTLYINDRSGSGNVAVRVSSLRAEGEAIQLARAWIASSAFASSQ